MFSYSREVVIIRVSTRIQVILILPLFLVSGIDQGTVFINEVFINPPGPSDEPGGDMDHEFIELLGTPGKKLDGYAIAYLNGTEEKYYPLQWSPGLPCRCWHLYQKPDNE